MKFDQPYFRESNTQLVRCIHVSDTQQCNFTDFQAPERLHCNLEALNFLTLQVPIPHRLHHNFVLIYPPLPSSLLVKLLMDKSYGRQAIGSADLVYTCVLMHCCGYSS